MARFYEKLTKPTALADGDIFVISVGSGTSWIDYKITYSQLKDVIKTISDMQNYYTKSQTYTKTETDNAIAAAVSSTYKFAGSKTCAELVSSLLVAANKGNVYNMTDSGTTTSDFVEGAGHEINVGDNVGIAEVSAGVYKFDLLSGLIDLTGYQTKNLASAIEGQTTVEGALAALSANKANLSEVYTKTQINDDFVKKSATAGLLKNDGSVDTNTYVPAVTGKGLSTEDYTSLEKSKLAGISDGATKTESSLNNGHLKIDGVEKTVYDDTALDSRVDTVEQDLSTDTATVTGNPLNFTTLTAQKAKQTVISLEPIQDLHGYDHPWPEGGGKNKLPITVDGIKAANTDGTWTGNTYAINGVTFTIQTDDGNNLTGILINGNSTSVTVLYLNPSFLLKSDSYILNGTPASGGVETWRLQVNLGQQFNIDSGNGNSFTVSEDFPNSLSFIRVGSGMNLQNVLFQPMIRLATETDPAFAPYSNICPIDGRTETSLVGTNGKESTDPDYVESNDLTIQFGEKVYGATVELEKGTVTVDTAIVDLGTLTWNKYSSEPNVFRTSSLSQNNPASNNYVSSHYKTENYSTTVASMADMSVKGYSSDERIFVKDSRYYDLWNSDDMTAFAQAMSGVQLCYELATPRTITLTPNEISLLLGVNNISTDGDSIKLTYRNGKVATLGDLEGLTKKIADCEDVEITDLQAGDSLVWDATAGKWKNQQSTNTHVYSTTEQVVGTWVDGSTIYEKTWEIATPINFGNSPFTLPQNICNDLSNAELFLDGMALRTNSENAATIKFSAIYRHSSSEIKVMYADTWSNVSMITIQYTKNNS